MKKISNMNYRFNNVCLHSWNFYSTTVTILNKCPIVLKRRQETFLDGDVAWSDQYTIKHFLYSPFPLISR